MAEVLFLPLTSGSPESLPACQRLPALRPTEKIMRRSHHIDMLNGSLLDKILLFAMPLAASSCLATAPAKTSGAVMRPEKCPPPRGSL